MTTTGVRQEAALRQVLRLVDLSRDLDRNRDDSAFADEGGEIVYVLDENIFELFIRPFRHTDSVETFYADIWSLSRTPDPEWRSFEAQAALIASEFLLSPKLPGVKDGIVRMTAEHRWELAQRVEDLTREFRESLQKQEASIRIEVKKKFEALTVLLANGSENSPRSRVEDSVLQRDLSSLRRVGKSEVLLRRFQAARIAASVLANDETTEPLDQLRRVVTPPIRSKLKTLNLDFPPSERDRKSIDYDAQNWFIRIVDELKRPGHRGRLRAQKPATKAIWNDARSIAFLLWISRHRLRPRQRLAFVTGDMVLYDAYRRWYSHEEQKSATSNQPFVMRRAVQYSPIFNPHDTKGDLSTSDQLAKSKLFSLIQQAVEASLLPLTLSLGAPDPRDRDATREKLALRAIDLDNLLEDEQIANFALLISDEWLSNHDERIRDIRDLWQETQRIAIGSSFDLVSARLSHEQREIISRMTDSNGQQSEVLLSDYAAKLLDRLIDDSIELWLPLAEEFLLTPGSSKRFSPNINIEEALAKDGVDVGPQSQRSPVLVFAKAAIHALRIQDTGNATRFANLALRPSEVRLKHGSPGALDLELQYLAGISYTVDIGAVGEHLKRRTPHEAGTRSLQRVKQAYSQASSLLHSCLSNHFVIPMERSNRPDPYDEVRYLRALSARASLNLFMAASIGLAVDDENLRDLNLAEASNYLRIAKGDLRMCVKLGNDTAQHPLSDTIRRQYLINTAAAEVLAYIFAREGPYRFDEKLNPLVRQVERLFENTKEPHALMIAELSAFLFLAGSKRPYVVRDRDVWQEAAHLRLPLDRAFYIAIQKHILGHEARSAR